jgi:myo-inositol 2-dehydrogenase/D-chiro-inositol 1-dehydrogenase
MQNRKNRIGVIGLGKMGSAYLQTLAANDRWHIVSVCDVNQERLDWAKKLLPGMDTTQKAEHLIHRADIETVGIFTLADSHPELIEESLTHQKHVMAEKPIAATVDREKALLRIIEASDRIVTVNLFNRNAWYHEEIRSFIKQGQIGQLAALTLSHQTPGLMPTEGHEPEGPPFHNCGMHYVDVARWYADSEYDKWHAQGIRMWAWQDPWWVTAHGHFKNGVVFNITQGFTYGHLAETKINHCGFEVMGTQGVVRMQHDFKTVRIAFHGVTHTAVKEGPYGGKKLDVMCQRFADALDSGDSRLLPTARDSVIASEVSQAMLDMASREGVPCIGTPEDMAEILAHREALQKIG